MQELFTTNLESLRLNMPKRFSFLRSLCPMSKQRKNYPLRLPAELFDEVKRWAEQEMRSVNGQIEFILKQAVTKRKSSNSEEPDKES